MDPWQRKKRNRVKDVVLLAFAGLCIVLTTWYVLRDRGAADQASQPPGDQKFAYRVLGARPPADSGDAEQTSFTHEKLRIAIDGCAAYLVKATQDDGQFTYRVNLDPSVKVSDRYNILRHAGTLYSLATYQQAHPTPGVTDAIAKASKFLQSQIQNVTEVPGCMAVWSDPEVNNSGAVMQAKLGGNGLALVALCAVEKGAPGTTELGTLQSLAEFVIHLQKPDGGFHSKYIPDAGGLKDDWTSLYYPGEAALGLLALYELDPNPRWREAAVSALRYLARSRESEDRVPPDHWAMIATAKLFSLPDSSLSEDDRQLLVSHARRVCGELSYAHDPVANDVRLEGCLTGDGRTTPTATRLEGLLAAMQADLLLKTAEPLTRAQAQRSIAFLLRSQIPAGACVGAIPRALAWAPKGHPLAEDDDFNRRAPEIRIDYVQHALSAMMAYHDLQFSELEMTRADTQ